MDKVVKVGDWSVVATTIHFSMYGAPEDIACDARCTMYEYGG